MRPEIEFIILDGCIITISVILLSVIHPGLYANDIHDYEEHRSKSMRLMDLKFWDRPD
ncbi:hypothetical protein FOMA001_g8957 [Fusarium oxysporum f. sp. matthiolae]|nr:hypothetical protein FOMA001_g8957 [Fusarium oxysporum f. sp. matthiolae]